MQTTSYSCTYIRIGAVLYRYPSRLGLGREGTSYLEISRMRDIVFSPGLLTHLRETLSKDDRYSLGTSLTILANLGERRRAAITYRDVPELEFQCRQMHISGGRKKIGLLALFNTEISATEIVILFAKEGALGNVSLRELNDIREYYNKEMARRDLGR